MKINKFPFFILLVVSLLISILYLLNSANANDVNYRFYSHDINFLNSTNDQNNNSMFYPTSLGDVSFSVYIYDINALTKEANIEIYINLENFPFNASSINLAIIGGFGGCYSEEYIQLTKFIAANWYFGNSKIIKWYLLGWGDSYPFDSYELEFIIGPTFSYQIGNATEAVFRTHDYPEGSGNASFNVSVVSEAATIYGEKQEIIIRDWKTRANAIPISSYLKEGFLFEVKRKPLIPFLEFVLPIEVCYYLLGASMFLDRQKPADRLRVYITLFIFSSSFFFSIHNFLPPRTSLSIPEFLLINLITSSAIIAVVSLIPTRSELRGELLDSFSLLISSMVFLFIYSSVYWNVGKAYYIFLLALLGLYLRRLILMFMHVSAFIWRVYRDLRV